MINIEDQLPGVKLNGLNSAKNGTLSGALTQTGNNSHSGTETFTGPVILPTTGVAKGVVEIVQFVGQTTEAATDRAIFIATQAVMVLAVSESHAVAAGGASTLQLVKDTGTTAPGAGTDLLTNNTNTGFDLNATANTVQVGALVATPATVTLAAGDRLSLDWANAIQSSAGIVVTVTLITV